MKNPLEVQSIQTEWVSIIFPLWNHWEYWGYFQVIIIIYFKLDNTEFLHNFLLKACQLWWKFIYGCYSWHSEWWKRSGLSLCKWEVNWNRLSVGAWKLTGLSHHTMEFNVNHLKLKKIYWNRFILQVIRLKVIFLILLLFMIAIPFEFWNAYWIKGNANIESDVQEFMHSVLILFSSFMYLRFSFWRCLFLHCDSRQSLLFIIWKNVQEFGLFFKSYMICLFWPS